MINSIRRIIAPGSKVFFDALAQSAMNTIKMSDSFSAMTESTSPEFRVKWFNEIENLEHRNDDITHGISFELGRIFITPISREDIYDLANTMDDVADKIYAAARLLLAIGYHSNEKNMLIITGNIQRSAREILVSVKAIGKKDNLVAGQSIETLKHLEAQANDIYDAALRDLYLHEQDFKLFIKKREIYMVLLGAVKKCKDLANLMDTILYKNIA
jgi:uncharacterized protein Yka (UPF0111/DUF47 family)